jgi:tripartite-type tricarboxylate transporter receptor subunit TctC
MAFPRFDADPMPRHALLVFLAFLAGSPAWADYPEKPVRMIVPFTPAGATDLLARIVGEQLGRRLGQPVVIENKPGAGANLGAEAVAHAPADGYTILMGPASVYAISATLYPSLGYDLVRDLAPVSLVANVPHVLLVNNDVAATSVAGLISLARQRPGTLNVASQGSGTVSHLEAELLKHMASIDMVHVPYRGSAPAQLDLVGGRVQVMFDSIAAALPQVRAGRLRALAVASSSRSPLLPDLPTVAESLPGYSAHSWLGLFAPAGTPAQVVERLQRETVALVGDPATRARLMASGFDPRGSSAAEFAVLIRAEVEKWRPVVVKSGARPD